MGYRGVEKYILSGPAETMLHLDYAIPHSLFNRIIFMIKSQTTQVKAPKMSKAFFEKCIFTLL